MSLVKKIITLLSGSVIAQLLTFLSYPILTLWLAPEQWATLGMFSAFVGVFSVWACGGLESAILLPKGHSEAWSLWRIARRWAIYLGALASVVLALTAWFFPDYFSPYHFSGVVLLLGCSVFFEGGILATMQWNNRIQAFSIMAKSRMIQSFFTLFFSITFAWVVPNYNGILVIAWVMGQAAAYGWLLWNMRRQIESMQLSQSPMHLAFAAYANFPVPSMLSSLFNAVSRQLPFFILPWFGNAALMGNFTLAHKILTAPIAFIGASLTQVFNVKTSQIESDSESVHDWTKRWLRIFGLSAILPFTLLMLKGPDLFEFFFGQVYRDAGLFAVLLAPWIFILYWINPLSHLINVHHQLKKHLYYNTMVLTLRSLSLWFLGSLFGFEVAVAGFGAIGVLAALYMAAWLWRLSRKSSVDSVAKVITESEFNSVKIVFTGDVAFTGKYAKQIHEGAEIWCAEIQRVFDNAAATVVNWEGPCVEKAQATTKGAPIAQSSLALTYCTKRNINVFNLANNHVHDLGVDQAARTTQMIVDQGGMPLGLNAEGRWDWTPQYICLNGLTIALIAIHEDEEKVNLIDFRKHLKTIRPFCDYIVLNYHGGEEYSDVPFPFKRRRLLTFIHEDIDVIVAHHPHVVQPMQSVGKKWIFYSLGNFIFDIEEQKGRAKTQNGALLQLNFSVDSIVPHWIPLTLENDKGTVSIGDRKWLESLQSRWESHEYQEIWTAECHRIRKEESQLTIEQVAERTDESAQKVRRMKWRSLFNPTRRTLLLGDWIYRITRSK